MGLDKGCPTPFEIWESYSQGEVGLKGLNC